MSQSHPFFGIHGGVKPGQKIPVLRTTLHTMKPALDPCEVPQRRLGIEIAWLDPEIEVGNISEADDKFMAMLGEQEVREIFRPVEENYLALTHNIIRQCTFIGQRTRRGAGTLILVNPDRIKYLITKPYCAFEATEPQAFGDWLRVGQYNTFVEVYTSPKVPFDRIYPIYKNRTSEIDAPAHFTVTEDGKSFVNFLYPDDESFAWTPDYIGSIAIED